MKFSSRKFIVFLAILFIVIGFLWLAAKFNFFQKETQNLSIAPDNSSAQPSANGFATSSTNPNQAVLPSPQAPVSQSPVPQSGNSASAPAKTSILLDVPFFSQAPFGEWSDPIFQNACEEASIIMAMHWVNKTSVTKEQAKQEILALTDFEDRTYGPAIDRAAEDAIKIFKDYYNYENVSLRLGIGAGDIKAEILKGNLVIAPFNGQILKNPFYTAPGPAHHMLVIIGFDAKTDEFITNDVGTTHGASWRYSEARIQASLQDYPTGNDLPSVPGKTAMIIVRR